ncbi:MAG: sugar phosphate nucleotidyltransferase, partial [Myxococcaceae bacterium]
MKSDRAKVVHPVLGRPLCAYPLSRALELGASPLVAVVGHQADAVKSIIEAALPGAPLKFATQTEQLGTGHAVRSAEQALEGHKGAVLILYGDTPLLRLETLQSLKAAFEKSKVPLAMVTTSPKDPTGYGRVIREGGKVSKVVEHKDCTDAQRGITEVNAGIYLADAGFLWRSLAKLKPANAQGEYYLTDLVEMASPEGGVEAVSVDFADTAGANDRAELAQLASALRERINRRWMKAGVSFVDPSNTYVEEGVELGADSELGPLVSLMGRTRIGKNVRIG